MNNINMDDFSNFVLDQLGSVVRGMTDEQRMEFVNTLNNIELVELMVNYFKSKQPIATPAEYLKSKQKSTFENVYAGILLEGKLIGVINLSDPYSAHNGLHQALTEHTGGDEWDMDFITPTPEDVNNPTNAHDVIMIDGNGSKNIITLIQTWIY